MTRFLKLEIVSARKSSHDGQSAHAFVLIQMYNLDLTMLFSTIHLLLERV
jgi:hypothetical protein